MSDEYVHFTVVSVVSKAVNLDEVEQAILKDNVFQQVVKTMSDGHWRSIKRLQTPNSDHSTTCVKS